MTATTEPRGGFDYGWDPGEDGWGPNMNANLLRLSRFGFHASVLSMTTTAPPGSPTSGAGYIIPAGATGAWAGKTGQIAVWDGSAWAYAVPRDGWTVHVVNVGLVVYEDGAWSQSNLATASGVGAEPYAGVPAQTSFWRSTAAGVRAWVQLVAADITDLATTLAGYLTKATLTGAVNFNSINSGLACAVEVNATSVTNAPAGYSGVGAKGFLVQGRAEANRLTQVWTGEYGIAYRVMISPGVWGLWSYLWDEAFLPAGTTGKAVLASATTAAARAAIAAAPESTTSVSASAAIGSLVSSCINITAAGVALELSGGSDGHGWDVFGFNSYDISIPSGVILYAYNGIDTGPTTRSIGGGRAIRICRISSSIWIAPNHTW